MSAQGTPNTPATPAQSAPLADNVKELVERYNGRGKIVLDYNASDEDKASFIEAVTVIQGQAGDNFKDWSVKAPEGFNTMALVNREHDDSAIFIGVPDIDTLLSDPTVRAYLYRVGRNKIVNAVDDEDSQEAMFITPAGCFKVRYDQDAFKFLARDIVKKLHAKNLHGVTIASLRNAFESSAFATSQFPRVPAEAWVQLIGVAKAAAEQNGFDPSIYDHWLATRDVRVDEGAEIDLGNIGEAFADLGKKPEPAPAAATAPTTPPATETAAPATA